jgi:hypothetical protein
MFREYNSDNQYIQFVAWDSCNKCKKIISCSEKLAILFFGDLLFASHIRFELGLNYGMVGLHQ